MPDDWTLLLQEGDQQVSPVVMEALVDWWNQARQRWPQLDLPLELFGPYVLARLEGAEDLVQELDTLRSDELYLACGCAYRDDAAVAILERELLPAVDHRVRRITGDDAVAQDISQEVRRKLLLGEEGQAPRITSYSGRGDFGNWLKVVGAREALMEKRRRQTPTVGDEALEACALTGDIELDYLRSRYAQAFRAAFDHAFAQLEPQERTLLRYHLVDRINIDQIAAILGTHRATAARRLSRLRQQLADDTKEHLMQQLRVDTADVDSILRMVRSQIDVSIHRLLEQTP